MERRAKEQLAADRWRKRQHDPACLQKVTVAKNGPMHVTDPARTGRTLCGVRWWFHSDHSATYCQKCQAALSKIYRPEI